MCVFFALLCLITQAILSSIKKRGDAGLLLVHMYNVLEGDYVNSELLNNALLDPVLAPVHSHLQLVVDAKRSSGGLGSMSPEFVGACLEVVTFIKRSFFPTLEEEIPPPLIPFPMPAADAEQEAEPGEEPAAEPQPEWRPIKRQALQFLRSNMPVRNLEAQMEVAAGEDPIESSSGQLQFVHNAGHKKPHGNSRETRTMIEQLRQEYHSKST